MEPIALHVELDPAAPTIEPLRAALRAYNESKVGTYERHTVAVLAHAADGAFLGGMYGVLAWGWLYIDWAFVDQAHRGRGLGQRLLAAMEEQARARGILRVRLNTGSFQDALRFYQRAGFEVFAQLEVLGPDGAAYTDYYLKKQLPPRSA